jgi:hypothetical protein
VQVFFLQSERVQALVHKIRQMNTQVWKDPGDLMAYPQNNTYSYELATFIQAGARNPRQQLTVDGI